MPSVVYQISNTVNDKKYIGIALDGNYERRFRVHLYLAERKSTSSILHKAIRKYGVSSFRIEPLEYFEDEKECKYRESELIRVHSLYPRGYNLISQVQESLDGSHYSLTTRMKISQSQKRRRMNMSQEEKEKHRNIVHDRFMNMSEEERKHHGELISKGMTGLEEKKKQEIISKRAKAIRRKYSTLTQEQREILIRKRADAKLSRNPNIDRPIIRSGKENAASWNGNSLKIILKTLDKYGQTHYGELARILSEEYPEGPPSVCAGGIESYWRGRIRVSIKKGYLEFEDGQPYIPADRRK